MVVKANNVATFPFDVPDSATPVTETVQINCVTSGYLKAINKRNRVKLVCTIPKDILIITLNTEKDTTLEIKLDSW